MELRKVYSRVGFFGQDNKAKIPVCDSVPVSTGVRANDTDILSAGDKNSLKALDHGFHVGNIIQSVTLSCNILNELSGSFFIGDDEEGYSQLFVTLCDFMFDPSNCCTLWASDFLLGLKELREKCLTAGQKCLPIYKDLLGSGKKIIQKGRKSATQERKEKESLGRN